MAALPATVQRLPVAAPKSPVDVASSDAAASVLQAAADARRRRATGISGADIPDIRLGLRHLAGPLPYQTQ